MPVIGSPPAVQTSKKQITYKESVWKVHRFSIFCGEHVADVEVLKMTGSLFIWLGSPGQKEFNELALGMPAVLSEKGACLSEALSTNLLGCINNVESSGLANKLAHKLNKPLYISCNVNNLNRFTTRALESGLLLEINENPKYF